MISNNSKKLKILTEFGHDENKSLLIEITQDMADKLDIAADGTVNTIDFIMVCLAEHKDKGSKPVDLDQLIFDTSIAYESRK